MGGRHVRGVSREGKAPVDELVGNVFGDRSADKGTPLDAVADRIAPGGGPEIIGVGRQLLESRVWYVG